MTIKYYGLSCFKIEHGEAALMTDPFDPREAGIPLPAQEADMVLYSQPESLVSKKARERINVSEQRNASGKDILEIFEPGEYEVGGIIVRVLHSPGVVVISLDGVNICYLGLAKKLENEKDIDDLGTIHYLIIPVGDGENFLEWKEVSKLLNDVDPGIVIPSCYKVPELKGPYADLKSLDEFAKELGVSKIEEEKKLKLQPVVSTEDASFRLVGMEVMKS
jgi:L-ascorbate metabolism protein UlaG (beta-lactamase superfamily)